MFYSFCITKPNNHAKLSVKHLLNFRVNINPETWYFFWDFLRTCHAHQILRLVEL